jgi:hypothetical protein
MPKKFSQKILSNKADVFTGRTNNIPMNLGTISATTNPLKIVAVMPRKGTITGVDLIVNTAITANDTNYWTFALTNKSTDGSSSTVLLAATDANTTKATGGIGLAAYDTTALTLSSTTADLNFNAGDVITLTATKATSASNLVDLTVNLKFKDR